MQESTFLLGNPVYVMKGIHFFARESKGNPPNRSKMLTYYYYSKNTNIHHWIGYTLCADKHGIKVPIELNSQSFFDGTRHRSWYLNPEMGLSLVIQQIHQIQSFKSHCQCWCCIQGPTWFSTWRKCWKLNFPRGLPESQSTLLRLHEKKHVAKLSPRYWPSHSMAEAMKNTETKVWNSILHDLINSLAPPNLWPPGQRPSETNLRTTSVHTPERSPSTTRAFNTCSASPQVSVS